MKTGSWYIRFDLTLEGESVRWEDQSEGTRSHIFIFST